MGGGRKKENPIWVTRICGRVAPLSQASNHADSERHLSRTIPGLLCNTSLGVQTSQGAQSVPGHPRKKAGRAFSGSPIHGALAEGSGNALEIQSCVRSSRYHWLRVGCSKEFSTVVMAGEGRV